MEICHREGRSCKAKIQKRKGAFYGPAKVFLMTSFLANAGIGKGLVKKGDVV